MNKYTAVLIAASLTLVACSTTKPEPAKAPEAPQPKVEAKAETNAATEAALAASKLAEQVGKLEHISTYFDFNKAVVKQEFHEAIRQQADFLLANKNDTVTLGGNCDERGSEKYNLALGERRAEAVSHQLQKLGVAKDRIKTISNGESKPRANCHAEKCWKENRRVDFIHQLN